jgi:hypothetical protein
MWFSQLRNLVGGRWPARRTQSQRPGGQLRLEQLEGRLTPANFTAGSVAELIADIHAANTAGESNTITLTAPTTAPYVLTATRPRRRPAPAGRGTGETIVCRSRMGDDLG